MPSKRFIGVKCGESFSENKWRNDNVCTAFLSRILHFSCPDDSSFINWRWIIHCDISTYLLGHVPGESTPDISTLQRKHVQWKLDLLKNMPWLIFIPEANHLVLQNLCNNSKKVPTGLTFKWIQICLTLISKPVSEL